MSESIDDVELHPKVRALLGELELSTGHLALAADAFVSWKARLAEVPDDERELMGSHLVAAALKLHRMGGAGAAEAITQLCELTALLLGTSAAAAVFEASDLPKEHYARVVGADATLRAPRAEDRQRPSLTKKPRRGLS